VSTSIGALLIPMANSCCPDRLVKQLVLISQQMVQLNRWRHNMSGDFDRFSESQHDFQDPSELIQSTLVTTGCAFSIYITRGEVSHLSSNHTTITLRLDWCLNAWRQRLPRHRLQTLFRMTALTMDGWSSSCKPVVSTLFCLTRCQKIYNVCDNYHWNIKRVD